MIIYIIAKQFSWRLRFTDPKQMANNGIKSLILFFFSYLYSHIVILGTDWLIRSFFNHMGIWEEADNMVINFFWYYCYINIFLIEGGCFFWVGCYTKQNWHCLSNIPTPPHSDIKRSSSNRWCTAIEFKGLARLQSEWRLTPIDRSHWPRNVCKHGNQSTSHSIDN